MTAGGGQGSAAFRRKGDKTAAFIVFQARASQTLPKRAVRTTASPSARARFPMVPKNSFAPEGIC